MRTYNYLLSYGFARKAGDKLQYTECGTGRVTISLTKKIKTINDIYEVEKLLKDKVKINNLENISLYSFSLLH